ncbi:cellulose biosynthesis cyclic di-GMP-binding regulatory protein BcsB [Rhizobium sp. FKY42]|uniref:cellulose biosynthesis cyclic di-GMP-binding regulatory protein BcsB n=1 Tax=Rhizobium sp. FKY42 TaxID=2562310 RepID=UPI0010C0FAA0|nr:cellulose biosynthesis cyclic di-GMP-binding regulatory protein BcsB [Rhizobium sp. FKY42]
MLKLSSIIAIALFSIASGSQAAPSLLPSPAKPDLTNENAVNAIAPSDPAGLILFRESFFESRLQGERDVRYLSFFLSPEQAQQGGSLRLTYTNAVSVRPEDATLHVSFNGHAGQQFPIRSPQGPGVMDVKAETTVLKPGWNTVTLAAQQHHRVDCSIDATYELWTQIDVSDSGFLPVASRPQDPAAVLMSVGRNSDGRTRVRVLTAGDIKAGARYSLDAVQTLALLLGRKDLSVEFTAATKDEPGIDLIIGDVNSNWQSEEGQRLLSAAPTGVSIRSSGAGRVQMIIRGAGEQAINAALLQALHGPLKLVLDSRHLSAELGVLNADQPGTYRLSDLAYRAEPFAGRLFRTSFQTVMPADFYPGDYGAMTLKLNAATAPKLAPGAQLVVRVNEKAVTSHGLIDPNGTILKDKTLDIPLRAFRPGINTVDILAELPKEEDTVCDPAARDESKPRFLLLEETSISVPALARAGRVPDLAAFAGKAYPFSRTEKLDLLVSAPSSVQLGAAATLISRLAVSAGQPMAANLISDQEARSATPDRNRLVLATAQGQSLLKSARLTAPSLDDLTTASVLGHGNTVAEPSDPRALLDAFQARTSQDRDEPGITENLITGFQRAINVVGRWLQYREAESDPAPIRSSEVLATLSQVQSETGTSVVTTVSAATDAELSKAIDHLTDPAAWSKLNGGSATVLRSTGEVISTPAGAYSFYPLADRSFANLRRLAAAWLSDHIALYAFTVVILVSLIGLWLGYIVPRKGVRSVE